MRLVLVGTIRCEKPGEFRAYHVGRDEGPTQIISIDGKPFSFAGGSHDSGGEQRINLSTEDHVIQWVCEIDLSAKPRLDPGFGPPKGEIKFIEIFTNQRQLFET